MIKPCWIVYIIFFEWGLKRQNVCMAFGTATALYNHNYKSNCEYFMNFIEGDYTGKKKV